MTGGNARICRIERVVRVYSYVSSCFKHVDFSLWCSAILALPPNCLCQKTETVRANGQAPISRQEISIGTSAHQTSCEAAGSRPYSRDANKLRSVVPPKSIAPHSHRVLQEAANGMAAAMAVILHLARTVPMPTVRTIQSIV